MSTSKRASLEELLEFANKVRAAGGGNPLDALLPAVPEDPQQCLIAKNLNFNCHVQMADNDKSWVMRVEERLVAMKIALAIETTVKRIDGPARGVHSGQTIYEIALPDRIGQVAADFDNAFSNFSDQYYNYQNKLEEQWLKNNDLAWDTLSYEGGDYTRMDQWTRAEMAKMTTVQVALSQSDAELVRMVEESAREAMSNATIVNEDGSIVL